MGRLTHARMNAFAHRYGILTYYANFVNDIEVATSLQTDEKITDFSQTFIYIDFNILLSGADVK